MGHLFPGSAWAVAEDGASQPVHCVRGLLPIVWVSSDRQQTVTALKSGVARKVPVPDAVKHVAQLWVTVAVKAKSPAANRSARTITFLDAVPPAGTKRWNVSGVWEIKPGGRAEVMTKPDPPQSGLSLFITVTLKVNCPPGPAAGGGADGSAVT